MIEWIFFFAFMLAAIIVYIILVRKKNRSKHIKNGEMYFELPVEEVLDKLD